MCIIEPSWSKSEEVIITRLRQWILSNKKSLPAANSCVPTTQSNGHHSGPLNTNSTSSISSTISNITLDSYSCINGQLLQRSLLVANEDKVAILTVWDGTKPSLKLNTPNFGDFATKTHECGVVEQMSEYCVYLVVYGAHIQRAKQLNLGGLYRFTGNRSI